MNRNRPYKQQAPLSNRGAQQFSGFTSASMITHTVSCQQTLTAHPTKNSIKASSQHVSANKTPIIRSPQQHLISANKGNLARSGAGLIQGGHGGVSVLGQSVQSQPATTTSARCRQLQPTAKFDSNSRHQENHSSPMKARGATGAIKTQNSSHKDRKLQMTSQVKRSQMLSQDAPSSQLYLNRAGAASQMHTNQSHQVNKEEDLIGSLAIVNQQSAEVILTSPQNLKFLINHSDYNSLKQSGNMTDQQHRESARPKFLQLDQPIMPLDFVESPLQNQPSSQSDEVASDQFDGGIKNALLQIKRESLGGLFSDESLNNFIQQLSHSQTPKECNLSQSGIPAEPLVDVQKLSGPAKSIQPKNQHFITSLNRKKSDKILRYSAQQQDSFSFAGARENSDGPRLTSIEGSIHKRLETLSSHNLKMESERSTCHRPFVSYTKRQIPSIGSMSPQKTGSKKTAFQYNMAKTDSLALTNESPLKSARSAIISRGPYRSDSMQQSLKFGSNLPKQTSRPDIQVIGEDSGSIVCCTESIQSTQLENNLALKTPPGESMRLMHQTNTQMANKQTPHDQLIHEMQTMPLANIRPEKEDLTLTLLSPRPSCSNNQQSAFERAVSKLDTHKKTQAQSVNLILQEQTVLQEVRCPSARSSQLQTSLHNCQDLSLAASRKGEQDFITKKIDSKLAPQYNTLSGLVRNYNNSISTIHKRANSAHSPISDHQRHRRSFGKSMLKLSQLKPDKANELLEKAQNNQQSSIAKETDCRGLSSSDCQNADVIPAPLCQDSIVVEQVDADDLAKNLLSRSLEPKPVQVQLLSSQDLTDRLMNVDLSKEAAIAYHDEQNSISHSSYRQISMNQTTNLTGMPLMVNSLNLVANATDVCQNTYKSRCKSHHNRSLGPNDDTTSQVSQSRSRRAQYHRLLTAGKVDECERQISIEMHSNNQDAILLYTRAKIAEKQKHYELAIEYHGQVLELDPDFFSAAYGKAGCENIIGRVDDAIETYELAFAKDNDIPVVAQSQNSRLTSKRSSPCNMRLSRKPSKLFGTCGSQSPFRIRSIEPQANSSTTMHENLTRGLEEQIRRQRSNHQARTQLLANNNGGNTGWIKSNIMEEDSEHSEKSPQDQHAQIIKIQNKNTSEPASNEKASEIQRQEASKSKLTFDEMTPCFQEYNNVQMARPHQVINGEDVQENPENSCTGYPQKFSIQSNDTRNPVARQSVEHYQSTLPGVQQTSKKKQSTNQFRNQNSSTIGSATSSIYSNPASNSHPQRGANKSLLMQNGPRKAIKKGAKRKVKAPQPWPSSALPSAKRSLVNNLISQSVEKLTAGQPTSSIGISNTIRSTAAYASNNTLARLPKDLNMVDGPQNVTLIGQVNIQLPQQTQQQSSYSPMKLRHKNDTARKPILHPSKSKTQEESSSGDKKDQKDTLASISQNQKEQTQERHKESVGEKHGSNYTRESHQQSDNKGALCSQESLKILPLVQRTMSQEGDSFMILSPQGFKEQSHLTNFGHAFDPVKKLRSTRNQELAELPSNDLSSAYHQLSSQLFKRHKDNRSNQLQLIKSKPSEALSKATGQNKADMKGLSQNVSTATIDQQPEWFMLAMSSYKLKKYGECLFAVSKAANAISKKQKLQQQLTCSSKGNLMSETVFSVSKSEFKVQLSTSALHPQISNAQINDASQANPNKDVLSIEDLVEGVSRHALDQDTGLGFQTNLNIDNKGNLSRQGQVQLGYLKAKCLCKLKRYSESLFQLAKINQICDSAVNTLSERQQNKMQLYKAICMSKTHQHKQAVCMLNEMLLKIAPQQNDLLDNMRESHFEKRKPLTALLIQAYNCRGQANQQLQDYEQALQDYNKLIELCQFQDLPTAKVFEYMTSRSIVLAKLENCKTHSSARNLTDISPHK